MTIFWYTFIGYKSSSHPLVGTWTSYEYCCCCSAAQSCWTLCDPYGLQHARPPCPSHLTKIAQVHIHYISDAIQTSHPLTPSSPALSLSQYWGLSKESVVRSRWAKNWTFSFSISASNEYSALISLKICLICLLSKGFSEVFSSTTVQIVTSAIILWNVTGYHILTPKRKNPHYQALCLNFRVNENLLLVNPVKNINIYSRQDAFKRELIPN